MRALNRFQTVVTVGVAVVLFLLSPASALTDAQRKELEQSKYVYISSTRKHGQFGKPAEIWFMFKNGAVYVASPPTTWRVRRIKAGRPQAKIAIGKPDGPSFVATGQLADEADMRQAMLDTYAKKYPGDWEKFAEKFRTGFKDGSRVLIKYMPVK
jgi:hypothetical protein